GGHHIPIEDIIRRNSTSFAHLYQYSHLVDNLILIDNSQDNGEIVMEINNGKITFQSEYLPSWVLPLKEQYQKQDKI
ncbi:hypothetical protein ABET36_00370, partial [Caldifermentibacillus hisashii]